MLVAFLYLLCHTGTLALAVDILRPGRAYKIPLFDVSLGVSLCVCCIPGGRWRMLAQNAHIGGAA